MPSRISRKSSRDPLWPVTTYLSEKEYKAFAKFADVNKRSLSNQAALAIQEHLERNAIVDGRGKKVKNPYEGKGKK